MRSLSMPQAAAAAIAAVPSLMMRKSVVRSVSLSSAGAAAAAAVEAKHGNGRERSAHVQLPTPALKGKRLPRWTVHKQYQSIAT